MADRGVKHQPLRSSRELLVAIADAQEAYDRKHRELLGTVVETTELNDVGVRAASWLDLLRGRPAC